MTISNETVDTCLVGEARYSGNTWSGDVAGFLIQLEKLMRKHRIVKLDVAWDPFAVSSGELEADDE